MTLSGDGADALLRLARLLGCGNAKAVRRAVAVLLACEEEGDEWRPSIYNPRTGETRPIAVAL